MARSRLSTAAAGLPRFRERIASRICLPAVPRYPSLPSVFSPASRVFVEALLCGTRRSRSILQCISPLSPLRAQAPQTRPIRLKVNKYLFGALEVPGLAL